MLVRWTTWHNDAGDCIQVSCALIDDAWEPLSEATELVGPFDELDDAVQVAWAAAHALADGQYRGQASLLLDEPRIAPGIAASS